MLYSPDDFIPAMSDLFKTCRDSGSVTMTVKPYDGQDRPEPRNGTPGKWRKQKLTLIRVSYGFEMRSNSIKSFITYESFMLKA